MKTKHRLLLVTCLIVTLLSSSTIDGSILQKKDPVIPIILTPYPTIPEGRPRVPSTTSIEASLDVEFSMVEVCLQNAGTRVTVDINNTTSGISYQYIVPGNCSDSLPIDSTSGFWTITFTLSTGEMHIGAFII